MSHRRWLSFFALLAAACIAGYFLIQNKPAGLDETQPSLPAILGAEWGMTPDAVRRKIGRELAKPSADPVFYRLVGAEKDAQAAIFEVSSVDYAQRPATVRLVFLDGKLSAYYVFLEDRDEERLNADLLKELAVRFGPQRLDVGEGAALKAIWSTQTEEVNYWLTANPYSLRPSYRAAVGVRRKATQA